jgi:hypothetical protein
MSDKLRIAKAITKIIAGIGVSKVVNDIITNNTTVENVGDAAKVWAGSIVIGSMVAANASEHVDTKFDAVVAWFEDRKQDEKLEYKSDR